MESIKAGAQISFGRFWLDVAEARLLRDGRSVALTPKAFDLLSHLATRPQRLVTKEELLSALWPDVVVTDASLKVCIREIRKALQDSAKTPTFIETVHRRGYRFIAEIDEAQLGIGAGGSAFDASQLAAAPAAPANPPARRAALAGRDQEMSQLEKCFGFAKSGRRQCVFISGEPGSGKTALAETFIRQISEAAGAAHAPLVLAGHCFEQFGTSEPYMPVWEAIARQSRECQSPTLDALLSRHAAAYPVDFDTTVATEPRGASVRLLREMADAIEALAAETPVVLLLEDVQWADFSTIDLLSALGRRRGATRLLVVATYRPAAFHAVEHPLRGIVQGLLTAGLCHEITLDSLNEPAVAQFLAARFPGGALPAVLTRRLHQRTDGNPLFLVHLVDDLIEQGVIIEQDGTWRLTSAPANNLEQVDGTETAGWLAVLETQIPRTVRAMIDLHLERLDRPLREALEAAAVAGMEFSAATVAAALGVDVVQAERACDDLARRHRFLQPRGIAEWPDATAATHYRFVHEIYHNVVYEQVPLARRVQMHQHIGLAIERAWAGRVAEEAAELAMHFERGRDFPRAVKYLRRAACSASRHCAHREAAHYLGRAVPLLDHLSEAERAEHELDVLKQLGVNLQVTRGFAAPEVQAIHARVSALCRSSSDTSKTFPVLWGIWLFHKVRSDLHKAKEMCDELLTMARASGDSALLLQAHQSMCITHLCLGSPDITRDHMERAAALYDPALHADNTMTYGQDPGVATLAFGAVALCLLSRPDAAISASARSLELARRLNQPSSLALAMHFAAMLHQLRGDIAATAQCAQAAIEIATEEGFPFWLAGGCIFRGWAQIALAGLDDPVQADAGLAEIRHGLQAWLATGSRTYHSYYLGLLADALQRLGRYDEALPLLDEALAVAKSLNEGLYEAELHRMRGRSLLHTSYSRADALDCYQAAIRTARKQGARCLERRAASDSATLMRRAGNSRKSSDLFAAPPASVELPGTPAIKRRASRQSLAR